MQKINLIFISIISIIIFLSKVYANEKNFIFDIFPFNEDGTINAVVEIPAGTLEKWEVTKDGSQKMVVKLNKKLKIIKLEQ